MDILPAEGIRPDLREDPAGDAAVGILPLDPDPVAVAAGNEGQDHPGRQAVPGRVPGAERGIIEAQRGAIADQRRTGSRALRARRNTPDILDATPFQDPVEDPLALGPLHGAAGAEIGEVQVPGADELTEQHQVVDMVRMRPVMAEGVEHV